jgi:kynureninase
VWCSYKYLNGGPGAALGGAFVHETLTQKIDTPRLGGSWGDEESTRFKMERGFVPKPNAAGCGNLGAAQVFNTRRALKASLTIFEEANINTIRKKSILLTNYLELFIKRHHPFEF